MSPLWRIEPAGTMQTSATTTASVSITLLSASAAPACSATGAGPWSPGSGVRGHGDQPPWPAPTSTIGSATELT